MTVRADREPATLRPSILGEGPGLPPGDAMDGGARVFDTFRRLKGSGRASGGTGLGPAIVKGFAEALGATVGAANRVDEAGARFSIVFPDALLDQVDPAGAAEA